MRAVGHIVAAWAVVAVWAALTVGCMSGSEVMAADVPPEGWDVPVSLTYSNTDTLSMRSLSLALRHSAGVEPLEVACIVGLVSPSGTVSKESLNVTIENPPDRAGRLRETTAPVGTAAVRLDEAGEWRFTVTPLQRMSGVWSVALQLNRTQQNGQR